MFWKKKKDFSIKIGFSNTKFDKNKFYIVILYGFGVLPKQIAYAIGGKIFENKCTQEEIFDNFFKHISRKENIQIYLCKNFTDEEELLNKFKNKAKRAKLKTLELSKSFLKKHNMDEIAFKNDKPKAKILELTFKLPENFNL